MVREADSPLVDAVAIELFPGRLSWPEPGAATHDAALGGNRNYVDLRVVGWREVSDMILEETAYLDRLRNAAEVEEEMHVILEEIEERIDEECGHPLWGLDVGTAAATLALAAAGCVTFTSCNGGAFGEGQHLESYPLVGFFMRPRIAGIIASAAEAAGVGLLMHGDGSLQVYSANAWGLHVFATQVFERRSELRRANKVGRRPRQGSRPARLPNGAGVSNEASNQQPDLFD